MYILYNDIHVDLCRIKNAYENLNKVSGLFVFIAQFS